MATFSPDILLASTFYVENLAVSTPENRVSFDADQRWPRIDTEPLSGSPEDRRYWTNVPVSDEAMMVDGRYNAVLAYDFDPYNPDPNAAMEPGLSYPYGERRARVVATLKDADTLRGLVLSEQSRANDALFPQDGQIAAFINAQRIRALPVKSDADVAYLKWWENIEAVIGKNEDVKKAKYDAIREEKDFDLASEWVTSIPAEKPE